MQCSTSNGRTAFSKCLALSNEEAAGLVFVELLSAELLFVGSSLAGGCANAAAVPIASPAATPSTVEVE